MPVPKNKAELQLAIQTNYDKLQKEFQSIPLDKAREFELEGHAKGTLMSVNNLLAYLIGWGALVLKWIDKSDHNEPIDFPEIGYQWNELGKLAQKFYQDYQKNDFLELKVKLDDIVLEILKVIEHKSNEELYETSWYKKWTLGRMIQFNTASPYSNARGRIRKWKKDAQKL